MNKNLSLFLIALVLGAAGSGLALLYLKVREADIIEALKPKSPPVAVVVASRDLVKGDRLDANSLSVREIPEDFVDPNAIRPDDFDSIEGEVLTQNLASGKPLLRSFIDREFPKDFSDTLAVKRRAMTIQIDETNSFSGLLRPGNRVDILVKVAPVKNLDGTNSDEGERILPVLENVEVIATGKDSAHDYEEKVRLMRLGYEARPDQNFTTITLNVTPTEAALLSIAKDKGDFLALLRNRKDQGGSGITGLSRKALEDNAKALALASGQRAGLNQLDGALVRGTDGLLRTKDDQVLANQDLVLTADGRILTKDGIALSGMGLSLDSQGRLVTADGRVVDPASIKRLADGTLVTADAVVLSGSQTKPLGTVMALQDGTLVTEDGRIISGATLNADGKLVLADGRAVDPADVIMGADGALMTKDGKPLEGTALGQASGALRLDGHGNVITADGRIISGATLNADGKLVLPDGRVVDPAEVVITQDGRIVTKEGEPLPGLKVGRPMGELHQDANGNLATADGVITKGARLTGDGKLLLAEGSVVDPKNLIVNADGSIGTQARAEIEGAKVRADGTWELADGTVVDPKDVIIHADGSVTTRDGTPIPGVKVKAGAVSQALPGLSADFSNARASARPVAGPLYEIDYIIGGSSKDGVAPVQKLPVMRSK